MSEIYAIDINRELICDTLVIGGGLAGSSAAITSARGGLDTILVEAGGTLGGQAGIGLVTPMDATADRKGNTFGGLALELTQESARLTNTYMKAPDEDSHYGSIAPQMTKYALIKMAHESGVKLHFHTMLADVATDGDRLAYAILHDKSGFLKVRAKYFIDATGDADLVYLSGDNYVSGSEKGVYAQLIEKNLDKVHESDVQCSYNDEGLMQPVSLFFIMRGVDFEKAASLNNKKLVFGDLGITRERFAQWPFAGAEGFEITSDAIPTPQGRVLVSHGRHRDEAVVNMSRIIGINGANADDLSDGETRAQLQMIAIVDFLKTFIPGFESAYLTEMSCRLGVRESRRLVGRYVLSGREVISCARFEDVICRANYIVDIHDPMGKNKAIGGQIEGDFFEIPYGSICSKKYKNLMAAGRCVSCDHVAASAVRIQGTCILTGQAAGAACVAAHAANASPCHLPYAELRKELEKEGVVL